MYYEYHRAGINHHTIKSAVILISQSAHNQKRCEINQPINSCLFLPGSSQEINNNKMGDLYMDDTTCTAGRRIEGRTERCATSERRCPTRPATEKPMVNHQRQNGNSNKATKNKRRYVRQHIASVCTAGITVLAKTNKRGETKSRNNQTPQKPDTQSPIQPLPHASNTKLLANPPLTQHSTGRPVAWPSIAKRATQIMPNLKARAGLKTYGHNLHPACRARPTHQPKRYPGQAMSHGLLILPYKRFWSCELAPI